VVLCAPSPGLLASVVKLVLVDFQVRGAKRLFDIFAAIGCNQEPHHRKFWIGLHAYANPEDIRHVDGRFHVSVLSSQQKKS
jgi:hypothetical protein